MERTYTSQICTFWKVIVGGSRRPTSSKFLQTSRIISLLHKPELKFSTYFYKFKLNALTIMHVPVWLVKSVFDRLAALFTKPGGALAIAKSWIWKSYRALNGDSFSLHARIWYPNISHFFDTLRSKLCVNRLVIISLRFNTFFCLRAK